jgi:hypothetical protein
MFSDEIIEIYTSGNCHLLSYYLSQRFPEGKIYVLTDAHITKKKTFLPEVVHSYLYLNGCYYDILGCHTDPDLMISEWKSNYMLGDNHYFNVRPMGSLDELDLDQYTSDEHYSAQMFIDTYIENYFL